MGPRGLGAERPVADARRLLWCGGRQQWGSGGKGGGAGAGGCWLGLRAVQPYPGEVFATDANDYCTRPGPRLVHGACVMCNIMVGVASG